MSGTRPRSIDKQQPAPSRGAVAAMERRLGDPGEMFRSAFENAPIGMALTGLDGGFLAANRELCSLTGRSLEELLQTTFQQITHPDDLAATIRDARRMLDGESLDHEIEKRYLKADGSIVWGLLHTALVCNATGKPVHFISHIVDITERKQIENDVISSTRRLHDLALRDPLTGLRNQRDFREALETEVDRAKRYGRRLSIALFDIDDFARVNAEHGRAHGDRLLREIGGLIESNSRRPDLGARTAGDTFGLILPETDAPGAQLVAERVIDGAATLDQADLSLSFGTASWPIDGETSEGLLWAAKQSLSAAKPEREKAADPTAMVSPRAEATVRRILELARDELPVDLSLLGEFVVEPEVLRMIDTDPASDRTSPDASDNDLAMIRFLAAVVGEVVDQERSAHDEHEAAVELTGIHALLAALEARDQYTGEHSRYVVALACRVAAHLGLGERETLEVEQVAQLHDIGKVGIPDSILLKRGPLTAAEWELMRQHPAVGERVVANTESLAHLAPAVRAEHERFDGGGYPDRLRGDEIPIASRITLACDAFHAMTSDRPYRKALSVVAARDELHTNAGTQFDPDVVDALLLVIDSNDAPEQP